MVSDFPPPIESIRLTIELTRDAELPDQWLSHCLELDIFSAGLTPSAALEAIAEGVRMVVDHEVKRLGMSPSDVMRAIADEVAART